MAASGHGWFGSGGGGGGGAGDPLEVGAGALLLAELDELGGEFGGLDGGWESRTPPLAPCTGGDPSPKKPPAAQPTITRAATAPPIATMRRRQ
jgi:hypothetical protein